MIVSEIKTDKKMKIIADLHEAFRKCEDTQIFWNNSLLEEMNGWVKSNLEANNWKYISKEEYEETKGRISGNGNKAL